MPIEGYADFTCGDQHRGSSSGRSGISRAFESVAKGKIPCISTKKRIHLPKIAWDQLLKDAGQAQPAEQ